MVFLITRPQQQKTAGPDDGVWHPVPPSVQVQYYLQGMESHLPEHGLQMSLGVEEKNQKPWTHFNYLAT